MSNKGGYGQWLTKDWTIGQLNALVKILGEETARKILDREIVFTQKTATKSLFDKNGRRIPIGLEAEVCDACPKVSHQPWNLKEKKIDYSNRIGQLFLGFEGTGVLPNLSITDKQFKQKTEHLLALIKSDPQIANILNGDFFPIVMPKIDNENESIGAIVKKYLLGAAGSIRECFGGKLRNGCLWMDKKENMVEPVHESRYSQLSDKMKKGSVPGIYFPFALQGFSVEASREQMASLPNGFILSGLDAIIAMTMYPGLGMYRKEKNIKLALSSIRWGGRQTFRFWADKNQELDFTYTMNPDKAFGNESSGLFFIGE